MKARVCGWLAVWGVLAAIANFAGAKPPSNSAARDAQDWRGRTQEEFAAADAPRKRQWMQRLNPSSDLTEPENTLGFQMLTWGLREKDVEVRRVAAWESNKYIMAVRNKCRPKNVGKLPIKRAVVEDFRDALKSLLTDADRDCREFAIISLIVLRGSAKDCEQAAFKLLDELSKTNRTEWSKRTRIINLLLSVNYPADRLPPFGPDPKYAENPALGPAPPEQPHRGWKKFTDNTWFDLVENAQP